MMQPALTTWGPGQLFAFSGLDGATDFDRGIVAQSTEAGLLIRQPGLTRIDFSPVREAEFGSDWANLTTETGLVRLAFANAAHLVVEGDVTIVQLDPERCFLDVTRNGRRQVLKSIGSDVCAAMPDVDTLQAERRAWVTANACRIEGPFAALGLKALHQMKGMVYAPEGQIATRSTTPDRYPHKEIWLWDSVFHAIGYRHLDADLAREMICAVLEQQLDSGQIGISFGPYSRREHRTQPPVLAWGVLQVARCTDDRSWVGEWLPALKRYLGWFEQNRMLGGLFAWVEDDGALGSVCDESGMDNSPRFASGHALQAVDLSCYMAQEYQSMAELDPEGGWQARAVDAAKRIEAAFWDDRLGFYCDREFATGQSSGVEAVTGFLPLLLGNLSIDRVEALVQAAGDPQRFGTALPLPSVARRHPAYAKDMWQGPVWVNFNWMIARGFMANGQHDLAAEIRVRTLEALQNQYLATGSIFEYYDADGTELPPALLRKGRNDPVIDPAHPSIHMVIHDYGWSATLALDWIARGTV